MWSLQARPCSTVAAGHVGKVADEDAVGKLVDGLDPDTLALPIDGV